MNAWFQDIMDIPYVQAAFLVNKAGQLIAASQRPAADGQHLSAMINAAEALARGLTEALDRGTMRMLLFSMTDSHLLAFPAGTAHYVIILTARDAPLALVIFHIQRILNQRVSEDSPHLTIGGSPSSLDDVDVEELIESVSRWLQSRRRSG